MTDYHIKSGKDQQLVLRDTKFVDLMMKRVFNVLIVANPYDAFMLEDDGRVDEKIFDEYIGTDASFMPDGFSVTVKDTDLITETTDKISAIANIQSASASPQVAEFLRELRKVVSLIAGAIIIALAVVSMIIISNTTKASVFARREEIQIMKYVGATNAFIRMPFFVEGMVTGLFAGAGAYFITWAVYRAVYNMITEQGMLMNTFGVKSLIPFSDIRLPLALAYLVFGALIGALGSVVSTRKHIDV